MNKIVHSLFPHAHLHHIAIALPDISPLSSLLTSLLPLHASPIKDLPAHNIRVSFLSHPEKSIPEIELFSPLNHTGHLHTFISSHPHGHLHHLCFAIGNLNHAINTLQNHGHNITAPPKIGAHGTPIVFIHPKTTKGILIELCE